MRLHRHAERLAARLPADLRRRCAVTPAAFLEWMFVLGPGRARPPQCPPPLVGGAPSIRAFLNPGREEGALWNMGCWPTAGTPWGRGQSWVRSAQDSTVPAVHQKKDCADGLWNAEPCVNTNPQKSNEILNGILLPGWSKVKCWKDRTDM